MSHNNLELLVGNISECSGDTVENKLLKLRDYLPRLNDVQLMILLKQISRIYNDKSFRAKDPDNLALLDALMDSIAEHMSTDFLMQAFRNSAN